MAKLKEAHPWRFEEPKRSPTTTQQTQHVEPKDICDDYIYSVKLDREAFYGVD